MKFETAVGKMWIEDGYLITLTYDVDFPYPLLKVRKLKSRKREEEAYESRGGAELYSKDL